jgi:hypothetical protein
VQALVGSVRAACDACGQSLRSLVAVDWLFRGSGRSSRRELSAVLRLPARVAVSEAEDGELLQAERQRPFDLAVELLDEFAEI